MGIRYVDFAFGVILDEFFDVHETELICDFLFWSHGVSEFPALENMYHVYFYY